MHFAIEFATGAKLSQTINSIEQKIATCNKTFVFLKIPGVDR